MKKPGTQTWPGTLREFQFPKYADLGVRFNKNLSPSALAVAFVEHVAHDLADDPGQVPGEIVDLPLQAPEPSVDPAEPLIDSIEPIFEAIEARLYRREIVAVAAHLFEDLASDHLFAFDRSLP
jgi:hypothetical protein